MLPTKFQFIWRVSEEKIKMWKVNGRQMPSEGKCSHCLWQGELKKVLIIINFCYNMYNFYLDRFKILEKFLAQDKNG